MDAALIIEKLEVVLAAGPVFLFSLVFHEYAHALAAHRLGDSTAAWSGRLTMNPSVHIDPIGSIAMPMVGMLMGGFIFGWAKPVPFNPRNLRNAPRDTMLIALAGPVSNLILLIVCVAATRALVLSGMATGGGLAEILVQMLVWGIYINALLAVFNMIPLPPLDGSKVLAYFLDSGTASRLLSFNPMMSFVLIILLVSWGLLDGPLSLLTGIGLELGGLR
ncbi:MAG: site-2 protease family protein [Rickettsiales bacterium]|nr:site-2 protease family protein [Rickettsiales bacterium]|tara:strand:- start:1748 stop:2407 length:660 start_codon:yes stop_codon:yes gene_type:complete